MRTISCPFRWSGVLVVGRFPPAVRSPSHRRRLITLRYTLPTPLHSRRLDLLFLGRLEITAFLSLYLLTLPLQLITTGSFLAQGSTPLIVLTAIHAGAVSAVFWSLLGNAIVSTQVVEDGTPSSIVVSFHLMMTRDRVLNFSSSRSRSSRYVFLPYQRILRSTLLLESPALSVPSLVHRILFTASLSLFSQASGQECASL